MGKTKGTKVELTENKADMMKIKTKQHYQNNRCHIYKFQPEK
jgi:hypothetical protein